MINPVALILIAGLAACQPIARMVDPETARLARFKQLAAARELATLAAEPVTCAAASYACRQLYLIKGDSCFELAARGDQPKSHYDCAIEALQVGLHPDPANAAGLGSSQPFAEKQLEALRRRRDLSSSRAESRPFAQALIVRGKSFQENYPAAPAGIFYEASGRLAVANDAFAVAGPAPATCAAFEDVAAIARSAPRPLGRYAAALAQIVRDAAPPPGCQG